MLKTIHNWSISVWLGGMEFEHPLETKEWEGLFEAIAGAEKVLEDSRYNIGAEVWHDAVIEDAETGKQVDRIKTHKVGETQGYNGFVCDRNSQFYATWDEHKTAMENADVEEDDSE